MFYYSGDSSLFRYVTNDPVSVTDPSGLVPPGYQAGGPPLGVSPPLVLPPPNLSRPLPTPPVVWPTTVTYANQPPSPGQLIAPVTVHNTSSRVPPDAVIAAINHANAVLQKQNVAVYLEAVSRTTPIDKLKVGQVISMCDSVYVGDRIHGNDRHLIDSLGIDVGQTTGMHIIVVDDLWLSKSYAVPPVDTANGASLIGTNVIFVAPGGFMRKDNPGRTILHEAGHNIGGLPDGGAKGNLMASPGSGLLITEYQASQFYEGALSRTK